MPLLDTLSWVLNKGFNWTIVELEEEDQWEEDSTNNLIPKTEDDGELTKRMSDGGRSRPQAELGLVRYEPRAGVSPRIV